MKTPAGKANEGNFSSFLIQPIYHSWSTVDYLYLKD